MGHEVVNKAGFESGRAAAAGPSLTRGIPFNSAYVIGLMAALDLLSVIAFYVVSFLQSKYAGPVPAIIWRVTDAGFCGGILYLMLATGSYQQANLANILSQVSRILVAALVLVTLEWLALWALNLTDDFDWPLSAPLNIIGCSAVAMCVSRVIIHRVLVLLANKGYFIRSIAVVGAEFHGRALLAALHERREPWTRIIGIFDDRKDRLPDAVDGYEIFGTVDELIDYARSFRVDEVLVALPWGAQARLMALLDKMRVIPANVRLAPDVIGHHFLDEGFDRLDGVPVYNIFRKPIGGWGAFLKRAEDLILGSAILLAVSPIILLTAIAVKLDSPGPLLFRQPRYGYNNKLIYVYKFRSMFHERRDENCEQQTTRHDPRVTRVGRIIRRTSIDELPQLFNVMLGDMSLVGPRPHAINTKAAGRLFEEVVREYAVRHKVKPGITGWAQVKGWRGETDTEEKIVRRVACDLYYMENWSLFLDIEILFRTVIAVVGKNAY